MEYQFRKSLLENELKFVLRDESLQVLDLKTSVTRDIPYKDIREVKLHYLAKRNMPDAYLCDLVAQNGAKIHLNSQHYQGIASFENRGSSYTPFVKAQHEKLASKNTNFIKGINPLLYWASMIFFIFFCTNYCFCIHSRAHSIWNFYLFGTSLPFFSSKEAF